MFKLGQLLDGQWQEHSHPPIFSTDVISPGQKVIATAPGGDPLIFETLASRLTPPFFLLYVLHTPRGEGEAGRYQSEEMSSAEVRAFLERFSDLLSADGRFDLWIYSLPDDAYVVWDRHNLIHAYGPAEAFVEALRGLGFYPGEPKIPAPHAHNYHGDLDEQARALLDSRDWQHSPLQPDDEQ